MLPGTGGPGCGLEFTLFPVGRVQPWKVKNLPSSTATASSEPGDGGGEGGRWAVSSAAADQTQRSETEQLILSVPWSSNLQTDSWEPLIFTWFTCWQLWRLTFRIYKKPFLHKNELETNERNSIVFLNKKIQVKFVTSFSPEILHYNTPRQAFWMGLELSNQKQQNLEWSAKSRNKYYLDHS